MLRFFQRILKTRSYYEARLDEKDRYIQKLEVTVSIQGARIVELKELLDHAEDQLIRHRQIGGSQ